MDSDVCYSPIISIITTIFVIILFVFFFRQHKRKKGQIYYNAVWIMAFLLLLVIVNDAWIVRIHILSTQSESGEPFLEGLEVGIYI